jgi:hypothetical protein
LDGKKTECGEKALELEGTCRQARNKAQGIEMQGMKNSNLS